MNKLKFKAHLPWTSTAYVRLTDAVWHCVVCSACGLLMSVALINTSARRPTTESSKHALTTWISCAGTEYQFIFCDFPLMSVWTRTGLNIFSIGHKVKMTEQQAAFTEEDHVKFDPRFEYIFIYWVQTRYQRWINKRCAFFHMKGNIWLYLHNALLKWTKINARSMGSLRSTRFIKP